MAKMNKYWRLFCKNCYQDNTEEVANFLRSGKVNMKDGFVKKRIGAVLSGSVRDGNVNLVQILLKYGADANGYNRKGFEPLYYAVLKKDVEIIKVLSEYGAKIDRWDYNLDLPLSRLEGLDTFWDTICDMKGRHILKMLMKYRNIPMVPVFYKIWEKNELSLLKFVFEEGFDYNASFEASYHQVHQFTPLCLMCTFPSDREVDNEIIEFLIKKGADPNQHLNNMDLDGDKRTPLACVSRFTHNVSLIKKLLQCGADINGQDSEGKTALHHCYSNEILKCLISRGIDVDIKNKNNHTAKEHYENYCRNQYRSNLYRQRCEKKLEVYEKCMEEISRMKSVVLNHYGLTLYDIFIMNNRHELSRYVNNIHLKQLFEDKDFAEEFSMFAEILKENFDQAKERRELMNSAAEVIKNQTGLKLPQLVLNDFFKYFTDNEITSSFLMDSNI